MFRGVTRKPTFFRWLTYQQTRNDSVGYIARVIIESKEGKPISSEFMDWYFFVDNLKRQTLIDNFYDAWEEYNNYLKEQ